MTIGSDHRGDPFAISSASHAAVFGSTGTGKTTLLEHVIFDAIRAGWGVTVLDPHGGLIDKLLDLVPPERTNDVILFDPTAERVPGLDALDGVADPSLAAEQVVHVFRSLWSESWGPRSEWLLQGLVLALMSHRKPTSLVSLHKALHSRRFRMALAEGAEPALADFFATLEGWTPRFREEALSPLINKAGRLSLNPHVRLALGQATPSFTFADVLEDRRILLCKLGKGTLGDAASLVGSLVVSKLSQAALGRQGDAPHLLACDEVQNFIHGVDLATVLAEARKYHLRLLLATQTLAQLPERTRSAIYGNCGTLASFRVSGEDAEVMHRELATDLRREVFQQLPNFTCRVRTIDGGVPRETAHVRVLPPNAGTGRGDLVRRESLRRWGRPRDKVEARIARHLRG